MGPLFIVLLLVCLFEVEAEDYHLGVGFLHRFGVGQHVFVAQLIGMVCVKTVAQTIHELQFGSKLEERQVKIASDAYFGTDVVAFEFDVVGAFAAQVYHWIDAGHEVRTVVVESWRCEDEVEGRRDIDRLQILFLLPWFAVRVKILQIAERKVAVAEVHGGRHAELEVGVDAIFAHHAHVESGVPSVLVGSDKSLDSCAVLAGYDLRAGIEQFEILHMCSYDHSEMERAEVGVGPVLHRTRLRHGLCGAGENCDYCYRKTSHICIYNVVCFGLLCNERDIQCIN